MTVRAKFKVRSKNDEPGLGCSVVLDAVYDSNPDSENGKFFRWTPSGCITMGVVNEAASAQFVVGDEVYVDFTPA